MKKKIDGESFLRSPAAERKKIGRIAKRLRRRHRGLSPQDGGREGVAIMTTAVGQRRCKTTTTHDRRDCAAEARHFTNGGKIPGSLQTQSRRRRYMRQPSARRRDPIYPDKPPPPPHILSFFFMRFALLVFFGICTLSSSVSVNVATTWTRLPKSSFIEGKKKKKKAATEEGQHCIPQ